MSFAQQTGSFVNHMQARGVKGQPEPVVGMGATLLFYTDRSPATIIKVETIRGKQYLTVQTDNYKRIDENGMSECQDYEYTRNENGSTSTWRQDAKGFWEMVYKNPETGRWKKSTNCGLRIGEREKYHDFCF